MVATVTLLICVRGDDDAGEAQQAAYPNVDRRSALRALRGIIEQFVERERARLGDRQGRLAVNAVGQAV